MKSGIWSTEFWYSLVATLLGFIVASGVLDSLAPNHWVVKAVAIAISVLGAMGYTANRTKAKIAEANKATAEALSNGSNNSDSQDVV